MIKIENLWHYYTVKPVLKDINLSIGTGELLTIMGPNGMGKSTLLALIGGMMKPLKGKVIIDGDARRNTVDEEKRIRQKVFYLPADPYLPPLMTGREFIICMGRLYGIEDFKTMQHTEKLLYIFDLKEKGDSSISSYSTGQKKKIGLCGALAAETPILVLDEPFSGGLDSSALMAMGKIIKKLAESEKHTIVMAVPVPELVEDLSHKIAIIRDGRLVNCGTMDELRNDSGCDGNLAEILDACNCSDTSSKVSEYLEERI